MIEIQSNPDKGYQEDKTGANRDDYMPCVVCGRACKTSTHKHWLHLFWSFTAVTDIEAQEIIRSEGDSGDLLYYPIGANCLKKHPELKPYVKVFRQA